MTPTPIKLSVEAEALGATIITRRELDDARRWQTELAVVHVSSAEAQRAVKAWARTHNLDAVTPKVDACERERRRALIARAIRKRRPLPVFSVDIRIFAWRSDAWL